MYIIKANRRKIENIFALCILTVFMGQIYITPYTYGFRLSLAVIVLSLFLLYFKDYNEMVITTLVGLLMFAFRGMIAYLGDVNIDLNYVIEVYIPVITFYISFGILLNLLQVRKKVKKPLNFILALWVCDSFSNLVEACFRKVWLAGPFDKIVMAIIMMGCIRTILTYVIFWMSNYHLKRFKTDQKEKYFREFILFTSKLKTELFFLNKSRDDIENAVSYVHEYYEKLHDPEGRQVLLKIAKDIHEIKKDYLRVIAGMESAFNIKEPINYMSNRDILYLIKDNMIKLSEKKNKKIDIKVSYNTLVTIKEYYPIISVLNNLAINSMDAIEYFGVIIIDCQYDGDSLIFIIRDSGVGIRRDKLDAIFGAGYSTKYDKVTGQMSSGIGLTHVEQIVTQLFSGTIKVESELGEYTEFIVKIPYTKAVGGEL